MEQLDSGDYAVSCLYQQVLSQPVRKRQKSCFDINICTSCELKGVCPTLVQVRNPCRVYYFTHSDCLADKRRRAIEKIPKERRKLRPNVEATVKEFRGGMNHKNKLKVRGKFKTEVYAFTMGISINFGRIFRYLDGNADKLNDLLPNISWIWQKGEMLVRKYLFFSIKGKNVSNSAVDSLQYAYQ